MVYRVKPMRPGQTTVGYATGDRRQPRLPAPPTQARGVEKRDRLYRAALARFRADGVATTRVEDVIADVGVSWATFFRYFPRKEDVLIEAAARHFREQVLPVATGGANDRRLRLRTVTERTFAALLEAAELTPSLHSEALLEVFAYPDRFAALVDIDQQQPMVGVVAKLLAEGQERGEVRGDVDAGAAALTVVAGVSFPGVQAISAGIDPGPTVSAALDILWAGLANH
jgi:AcrR family transcriptional regulator